MTVDGKRMKLFEDEMTETHAARTESEYRAVTRQEVREQLIVDHAAKRQAQADATFAVMADFLRRSH